MRATIICSLLIISLLPFNGCSDKDKSPVSSEPEELSQLDQEIMDNFFIVMRAIENWRDFTGYVYPGTINEHSPTNGDTVIDLLPGRSYLVNPISGVKNQPFDGHPIEPGAIGYIPIPLNGLIYAYRLIALGEDGDILYEFRSYGSEEEGQVIRNAHCLFRAIFMYSNHNNGLFPRDLNSDTNLENKTAMDYLAFPIVNPYTQEPYDPDNIDYSSSGSITYIPIPSSGDVTNGIVIGMGDLRGKIVADFHLIYWDGYL